MIDFGFKTEEERQDSLASQDIRMKTRVPEEIYAHHFNYKNYYLLPKMLNGEQVKNNELSQIAKTRTFGFNLDSYILNHQSSFRGQSLKSLFFFLGGQIIDEEAALYVLENYMKFQSFYRREEKENTAINAAKYVSGDSIMFFPFKKLPLKLLEKIEYEANSIELRQRETIRYILGLKNEGGIDRNHVIYSLSEMVKANSHLNYARFSKIIDASVKLLSQTHIKHDAVEINELQLLESLRDYPWLPLKYSSFLKKKFKSLPIPLENNFINEYLIYGNPITNFKETIPVNYLESYYLNAEDKNLAIKNIIAIFDKTEIENLMIPKWFWDHVLKDNYENFSIRFLFACEPYLDDTLALQVEYLKSYGYYLPEEKDSFKNRLIMNYNQQGMELSYDMPLDQIISIFEAELDLKAQGRS